MKFITMESQYSNSAIKQALNTLVSIEDTLSQLIEWNKEVSSSDYFAYSKLGLQLLAADAMLISAIGEGINNVNCKLPNFLNKEFPEIPWREIIGMRNHIVHGYFDLNAEIVFDAIKNDIPTLIPIIQSAIRILNPVL